MGWMCEQWSWMWGEKTPSILYKYGLGLPYKISNTCVKLHSSPKIHGPLPISAPRSTRTAKLSRGL